MFGGLIILQKRNFKNFSGMDGFPQFYWEIVLLNGRQYQLICNKSFTIVEYLIRLENSRNTTHSTKRFHISPLIFPISIHSLLNKAMRKVIVRSILEYLEKYKLTNDKQYVFRHKRSIADLFCGKIHCGHFSNSTEIASGQVVAFT